MSSFFRLVVQFFQVLAAGTGSLPISRQTMAYTFFGAAVVFGAVPITIGGLYGSSFPDAVVWGVVVMAILALGALYCLLYQRAPGSNFTDDDVIRFTLLLVIGLIGLATAALGVSLAGFHADWRAILAGGIKSWRSQPTVLVAVGGTVVGGLVLMFAGLGLGRTYERTQPMLRRTLYGYNAVLGTLLVILVLLMLNVMAAIGPWPFTFFSRAMDWTSSGRYSLKEASINFLEKLDQPVKINVLLNETDPLTPEMQALLGNISSYTKQITWEFVGRDRNRKKMAELQKKYNIPEPMGVLIVYGSGTDETDEFVKYDDLYREQPIGSPTRGESRTETVFLGEHALMKALNRLAEGKGKPKVYFTKGHNELDINQRGVQGQPGLGQVTSRLREANYELRELNCKDPQEMDKGLKEADVVVIARPMLEFSPREVDALRRYLRGEGRSAAGAEGSSDGRGKKGKLFILLDIVAPEGKMVPSGLEGLLAEHSVHVNDDRVLVADPNWKLSAVTRVLAMVNPETRQQVFVRAFFQSNLNPQRFLFRDARSVSIPQPAQPNAPAPRFLAETLIQVYPGLDVWCNKNLDADPEAQVADLRKNPELYNKTISRDVVALGVTVTEPNTPDPSKPHGQADSQPRMVVFGNARWVSNEMMLLGGDERGGGQFNEPSYQLFRSCLSWLRERSDIGSTADANPIREFQLSGLDANDLSRLLLLPAVLMILSICTLGIGVWVVRRR